jgi:predicted SnoaL-like aldol condensation-catalyzing enzyme
MTANIVKQFIEEVWNARVPQHLEELLHPDFVDHSLPDGLEPDAEGLKKWIALTSASFEHRTEIEDQVTEGDKSVIRVTMHLKHIGVWRGMAATGKEVTTRGYRTYRVKDGKIIEHWALIDGSLLESKLREVEHGCAVRKG